MLSGQNPFEIPPNQNVIAFVGAKDEKSSFDSGWFEVLVFVGYWAKITEPSKVCEEFDDWVNLLALFSLIVY